MKLIELFSLLGASEIFTYEMTDPDTGDVLPRHRRRIVQLINLGLIDLHSRFNIREDTLVLNVDPGITRYILDPKNNLSVNTDGYIDDSSFPFLGNLIEILRVQLPTGRIITLNQSQTHVQRRDGVYAHDNTSVSNLLISTPTFNELLFAYTPTQGQYYVSYKGGALRLPMDDVENLDATTTEVILPDVFINALCYFVASKVYNPAGAESVARSMFHEGNNWTAKYHEEVSRLKSDMSGNKVAIEMTSFQRGGWV